MDIDFIELLVNPPAAPPKNERDAGPGHYVECLLNDDSWETVVCSTCGRPWVSGSPVRPN